MLSTFSVTMETVRLLFILLLGVMEICGSGQTTESGPSFDKDSDTLTVVEGDTALLPCNIKDKGQYKVTWERADSTVLTYEDRRVVDDFRFSVSHVSLELWDLLILNTESEDRGTYHCKINTIPLKIKTVVLYITVPPTITSDVFNKDKVVTEGTSASFTCSAAGAPEPEVTWSRFPVRGADEELCQFSSIDEGNGTDKVLVFSNASRHCQGEYKCLAFNGLGPGDSRILKLRVQFPPNVTIVTPSQINVMKGKEAVLECSVKASPHGVTLWKRDGHMIQNGGRHQLVVDEVAATESIVLTLKISSLTTGDSGKYTCSAMNPFGTEEATVTLEVVESALQETLEITAPTGQNETGGQMSHRQAIFEWKRLEMMERQARAMEENNQVLRLIYQAINDLN